MRGSTSVGIMRVDEIVIAVSNFCCRKKNYFSSLGIGANNIAEHKHQKLL